MLTMGCFGIPNSFNHFYRMRENFFVAREREKERERKSERESPIIK